MATVAHAPSSGRIPLAIFLLFVGLGVLTLEPILLVAALSAAIMITLLRHKDNPPIILFCLGYQFLFCIAGIIYRGTFGKFPSDHSSPHLTFAVGVLLSALTLLALGIYSGMSFVEKYRPWIINWYRLPDTNYSISRLFVVTICCFAMSWFLPENPRVISYATSQIMYRVLEFRYLFLFLLYLMVLRQRKGYMHALIGGLFVSLPLLVTGGSGFARSLLIFFLCLVAESRALTSLSYLKKYPMRALGICLAACALLFIAVLWNGAIKARWRMMMNTGQVQGSLVDKLSLFRNEVITQTRSMDVERGLWQTGKRISDVPMMMALVYGRVPEVIDHTDGELVMRAIRHVTMPRFLFPNKGSLGSDSVYVERFAGLVVAGEAEGASIGMGYLIEFYIDFGFFGMALGAFVFGLVIGVSYRGLALMAPSKPLYFGTSLAIMLQHFMALDGSLPKILGGLIMAFVVHAFILGIFGRALHRMLGPLPSPVYLRR